MSDGPEIAEPVSDTFATLEDSNVTLICGTDLRGNPKPTVEWFTNTGETVNDQCFSTSNDSDTVSLTIYGATLNDSGIWSCVVSSNLTTGQLQRNLTLTILGKQCAYVLIMMQCLYILEWYYLHWTTVSIHLL